MRQRSGDGFTLVEMMIVLAILAILAALAYPTFTGVIVRTRRVEGQAALVDALQKQELYRARHSAYAVFTAAEGVPADLDIHWWSGRDAPTSAYEIDAQACVDAALADCVELRARPGTARVDGRFRDPDCGALTLDSRGRQGATGPAARCWP